MLCLKCGAICLDTAKKCEYCGYQMEANDDRSDMQLMVPVHNDTDKDADILASMKKALKVFEKLEKLEKKENDFLDELETKKNERDKAIEIDYVDAEGITYIVIIVLAFFISLAESNLLMVIVITVVTIFVCTCIFHPIVRFFTAPYREEKISKISGQVVAIEQKVKSSRKKKEEFLKQQETQNAKRIIPEGYRSSNAVACFIKYFESGRAENLKEAINLYEDSLHKQRVEALQQAQLEQNESKVKCPKCGSHHCVAMMETKTTKKGYSMTKGCCGYALLGPFGFLCGACGSGEISESKTYWVCQTCGRKFTYDE